MDPNFFRDKKKADLVDIVRMTKIMPISHAQRMKKSELVQFLEQAHLQERLSPAATSVVVPTGQREERSDEDVASPAQQDIPEQEEEDHARRAPRPRRRAVKQADPRADTEQYEESRDEEAPAFAVENETERTSAGEGEAESGSAGKTANRPRSRRRRRVSQSALNRNADTGDRPNEEDASEDTVSGNQRGGRRFTAKPRPRRARSAQARAGAEDKRIRDGLQEEDDRVYTARRDERRNGSPYEVDIAVEEPTETRRGEEVRGILEIMQDGYGFIRKKNYMQGPNDVYVQPQMIRRFQLRNGDEVTGFAKDQKDQDRYQALNFISAVNGLEPEKMRDRPVFGQLTPIYPEERYSLETERGALSGRIIDLIAPIGKGQRGMIVSPPKAGKTVMMQQVANAVTQNNPEAHLMVLLIDERPEEVTDMERRIRGEVVSSTFDKPPENHVKIAELVLERAKRLVEMGKDVLILMDSITRLARAYNLTINPTGRTLTGGLDPGALHGPKRFFGAARNIEDGGSLTILATALIDTGSRMDEVIFEEFKGTGNMEVHLDRKLADKRVYPAIDVQKSSTRREDLLLDERTMQAVWLLRKSLSALDSGSATEMTLSLLKKTKSNDHFVMTLMMQKNDKAVIDALQ